MYRLSSQGIELIEGFEGFRSHPYLDSAGVPTIGLGTTVYPDGTRVTMQDAPITKERALELFEAHLKPLIAGLEEALKPCPVELLPNEMDALISFAYNEGLHALLTSTLFKLVLADDLEQAAENFVQWDKDRENGVLVENAGLLRRRKAERAMFIGLDWKTENT